MTPVPPAPRDHAGRAAVNRPGADPPVGVNEGTEGVMYAVEHSAIVHAFAPANGGTSTALGAAPPNDARLAPEPSH
jgi:hypothetical protein